MLKQGGIITEEQKASDMHAYYGFGEVELDHLTAISDLAAECPDVTFPSGDKNREDVNAAIGQVLTFHPEAHRKKFWIYINPVDFANPAPAYQTLTIGFRKENATKSSARTKDGVRYYYDTDWVVVDDIKMSYMGLAPAFLYEDETSLDYLVYDANLIDEQPSASPDFHYSGGLSLAQTMKKGQWNSFSMPIPLTGEQVRYAFGEEAHLLELVGIGSLSQNVNVIDFRSVELKPIDPETHVVVPGKFYMLKPTIDPITGEDPLGRIKNYYNLGRNYFSVNPEPESNYQHFKLDANTVKANYSVLSIDGSNDGTAYVSYVMTPFFSSFAIDANGYNTVSAPGGLFVPKGGYAVSGGTIYELNRDTPIKGFRGWIVLSHSIFDDVPSSSTPGLRFSIDGNLGDDVTGLSEQLLVPINLSEDTSVYDLMGRKVGTVGTSLPKGFYIVQGKKFYVK